MTKKYIKILFFFLLISQFLAAQAPIANRDFDTAEINTTLNVAAPGVLANDTDPDNDVLNLDSML